MRAPLPLLAVVAAAIVGAPAADAQECNTGIEALCDALADTEVDRLFGDWGDVGVLASGFLLLVVFLTVLLWLFRKRSTGPKLRVEIRDAVREVGPGGTIQLLADVENAREHASTDVDVTWGELPAGWSAVAFAAVAYPSGFTAPQTVGTETPLHLTTPRKGGHRATVAVQLTAPEAVREDETLDVRVRIVPVTGGVRRPRRGRTLAYSVLLGSQRPVVQITNVTHEPDRIAAGQPVLTRAVLANAGAAEAKAVGVSFLLNEQPVEEKVVPALAPNEQATLEFHWVPAPGENRIRIHVA